MIFSSILTAVMAPKALYIDPAATTVLLSSVSAIVIAVGATAVLLWRRAKKKVSNALHIDPNAHKEVEDEIEFKEDETEKSDNEKND